MSKELSPRKRCSKGVDDWCYRVPLEDLDDAIRLRAHELSELPGRPVDARLPFATTETSETCIEIASTIS